MKTNLRHIIRACLSGSLAAVAFSLQAFTASAAGDMPAFKPGDRILFQGDSITDGGRARAGDNLNHTMGQDYAYMISGRLGVELAERHLTFINRGISGNKVSDLAARWQNDTLNVKPDILSILIGVNNLDSTTPEDFEKSYDKLLADTVAALPHVRLVLGEPFTLPSGKYKDPAVYPARLAKMKKYDEAVARLAAKYKAPVVHYQQAFEAAVRRAPAEYWLWDGVHPTYPGHHVMAEEWVRAVTGFYR